MHPLGEGGERIEGLGHIFVDSGLAAIPAILFDPNDDGVWFGMEDAFEWANPFPGTYDEWQQGWSGVGPRGPDA